MTTLIEQLNKNISQYEVKICIEEKPHNNKTGFIFSGSIFDHNKKAREKIRDITANTKDEDIPRITQELAPYQITVIDKRSNYPSYHYESANGTLREWDCKDWLFNKINLPQYMYKNDICGTDELLFRNLPEIAWIPEPEVGCIAAYFINSYVIGDITHWGIVREINTHIMVDSKWGQTGHVYHHPLTLLSASYGDGAFFFKRK